MCVCMYVCIDVTLTIPLKFNFPSFHTSVLLKGRSMLLGPNKNTLVSLPRDGVIFVASRSS